MSDPFHPCRLLAAVCSIAAMSAAARADAPPTTQPDSAVVLDTYSYWRAHVTLRPPLFGTQADTRPDRKGTLPANGAKPVIPLDQPNTPAPPPGWAGPDFDDSAWWRESGPLYGGEAFRTVPWEHEAYSSGGAAQPISMAVLSLRGKFTVTDPARVGPLTLSLAYRGGVVVYLNGREAARRDMPAGPVTPDTLADDYPWEAWVLDNGEFPNLFHSTQREPLRKRIRRAEGIRLPAAALRRGVNVLALEFHRAAHHPNVLTHRPRWSRGGLWNTVGFVAAELTVAGRGGGGVVLNTGRPAGVQLWNANPLEGVFECSYGDPAEPLRPIRIVAARNGRFSGQVVVGSGQPIRGLSARVGDLCREGGGGAIPASAVSVHFPRASIAETGARLTFKESSRYWSPLRFDALFDRPADPIALPALPERARNYRDAPWRGAVQPVWLTVRAPADAAAGEYRGELTISAERLGRRVVPIELTVSPFTLPAPADFQTSVGFLETPESLAVSYRVPLWSDQHWAMVERSMELLARTGNRVLFVPLICRTHFRNAQTMVRWVADGRGGFQYDFSLLDRYLDTALKAGNRPRTVCLQVWDYNIGNAGMKSKIGTGMYGQSFQGEPQPVPVSRLAPLTGEVEQMAGPRYGDPAAEAFWRPVAEGVRKRLADRGLLDAAALGTCGDYVATQSCVDLWARLMPGAGWVTMAHGTTPRLHGQPIAYATSVFVAHFIDPALERKLGWQRPANVAYFPRYADNRGTAGTAYERTFFEFGLACGLRGAGRQNLDDFTDYARRAAWGSDCCWGSLTPGPAWLAAGPAGPVATERFEMGVEGIGECEARILIEKALAGRPAPGPDTQPDGAAADLIGDELADRCRRILDERTRCVAWANEQNTNGRLHSYLPIGPLGLDWFAASDWQGRAERLYAAAAEAAAALGRP